MSEKNHSFDTGMEVADEYLNTIVDSNVEVSTAKSYETNLRQYGRYLDREGLSPYQVTIMEIKDHLGARAEQNLSKKTISNDLTSIKNLYEFLRLKEETQPELDLFLLDNISASDFNTPTLPDQEPLLITELEKLCEATNCFRDKLLVVVGGEVGARNEALRLMKLSEIDLQSNMIDVKNTKSGGSVNIPISDELAMQLERWIRVERKAYSSKNSGYLFPSRTDKKLNSNKSLWDIIHDASNKAGIQRVVSEREFSKAEKRHHNTENGVRRQYRVSPHTLRHTFAHLLEEAGLSSKARRDALDHDNLSTTEEHYSFSESEYEEQIRDLFHDNDNESQP
ncbi:tyrosine-type recombinase/integrase [Haloarcula sp. NS06]|uniref:tyrosine-type recombinase/integrase n=1 Tax=Haloarcula sp. NS06 TaxID=3409688 RepID=UPI003DA6F7AD